MKSLILAVGTLALAAPAVAGTKKSSPPAKPAATVQVVAPEPIAAPEQLDIPALPADSSSPLEPLVVAKPLKPSKHKPAVLKTGTAYTLGARRQATKFEREVEQIIPRSLGQAQVATVVQAHMSDVQNCWDLVPKAERTDACSAQLTLTISDAGAVTAIELGGDVPASAHECMTSAISKWSFPAAETRSVVEYGISLRSL